MPKDLIELLLRCPAVSNQKGLPLLLTACARLKETGELVSCMDDRW